MRRGFLRSCARLLKGQGSTSCFLAMSGRTHSDIGEDVFRGFALADGLVPFVVINDNDAEAARPFTLIHELAHIWIGASGVSGPLREVPENVVERFCNDTASRLLLPPDAIPDFSSLQTADFDSVNAAVTRVAGIWNVSEPAVAYRFAQKGWIARALASSLFAMFADRWRREKEREKQNKKPDDTGPSFYTVRRHRLRGRGFSIPCAVHCRKKP